MPKEKPKGQVHPVKPPPDSDSPPDDDSDEEEESSSRAPANKPSTKAVQSRVPLLPDGAPRSDDSAKPATPRDRFRERGSRGATPRGSDGNGGLLSALDAAANTGSSWLNTFETMTGLDVDGDGGVGQSSGRKKSARKHGRGDTTPMSAVARSPMFRSPGSAVRPSALSRPRMHIVRDVYAHTSVTELTWRLLDEPWFEDENFGGREGFVTISGDLDLDGPQELVRVSNALAGIARACHQADAASMDGSGRCFVVCDLFSGLSEKQLQDLAASDQAVSDYLTGASASQPLVYLQRALCRQTSLALVMLLPMAMMTRIDILRQLLPAHMLVLIELAPSSVAASAREPQIGLKLLAAITRCSEPSGERPRRRAAALVVSGEPLPLLAQLGFCARHDVRVVLLEVASPAASMVQLLRDLWPRRTVGSFNPIAAQDHLSQILEGVPGDPGSVDDLRDILTRGRIVLHPAQSSAENLESVFVQELTGDRSLRIAKDQRERYLASRHFYSWPSSALSSVAVVLTVGAAAAAVAADELYNDFADYDEVNDMLQWGFFSRVFLNGGAELWARQAGYICAALPALLAVVELLQSILRSSEAAAAVERAAGLVERASFLYRCRAGSYADLPLSTAEAEATSDVSTLRRRMLTRDLAAVAAAVDDSGAMLVPSSSSADAAGSHDSSSYPMWLRRAWCMCCCRPRNGDPPELHDDRIDGQAYAHERLLPALQLCTARARWLLGLSMAMRCASLISLAVGTALALIGLLHWVAVAVACSTAASRLLEMARVDERRRANVRAAAALNAAKVRWEALPVEAHAWQSEVDALVLRAEQAIESTLPVVPGFGQGSGGLILTSLVFEVYTE